MKILLAIDGSDPSKKATDVLTKRSLPKNTAVHIVMAYDKAYVAATVPGTIDNVAYHEDLRHLEQKAATEVTHAAAEQLLKAHPGLTITEAQVEGSPKKKIIEEAKKFNADLIMVGSKGHGALETLFLGSVSQSLANHADCSVEIVR